MLLQGDHAAAEAPRSPEAHGDGALHDRRDRRGGEDLRGMARRGARRPDRAAHVGGLHRSGRSATRIERLRRRRSSTSSQRASSRSLRSLSYRAPALVAAMLEDSGLAPSKSLDVLDAGCGTGLCGPLLAPYARRLTGVDLSAGMLARAKEKNVYDALVQGELTEYLRDSSGSVRPDRLGRHAGLFRRAGGCGRGRRGSPAARRRVDLYARGCGRRRATLGYRLELHGRYSHSRAVCRTAAHRRRTGAGDRARRAADGVGSAGGGAGDSSDEDSTDAADQPSLFALMSYLKWIPASSDPSAFCGLYSRSTLAN